MKKLQTTTKRYTHSRQTLAATLSNVLTVLDDINVHETTPNELTDKLDDLGSDLAYLLADMTAEAD